MMRFGVVTLFPEMFSSLQFGVCKRALQEKKATLDLFNPRDWASAPHRQVDDRPYGGGPGLVMMYEPLSLALTYAKSVLLDATVVYLSPQGRRIQQRDLHPFVAAQKPMLFLAGRYEGIDERVIEKHVDEEWSLGDFVLSGGEIAAMAFIDAMIRLLPGTLGNAQSVMQDSFADGLLEYPQYTRPPTIEGMSVPLVLTSGNHLGIQRFRKKQALGRTWMKRPDLLEKCELSAADEQLLNEFIKER